MRKPDHIATLTIHHAGRLTDVERSQVADWMRKQADDLETQGEDYSEFRYTARFHLPRKEK